MTDEHAGGREGRTVRIAAVGDFHCGVEDRGAYRSRFARLSSEADVLAIAGDLTRHGTPEEVHVVVHELTDVDIPIVAVLGNHDHESGRTEEVCAILRERGIHLLDGTCYTLDGEIGFTGTKGYMGGFGRGLLTGFGEAETKRLVEATQEEVKKLEMGLRELTTPVRVAVLHYAPVMATVVGEPEQIYPFLGTDRLAEPLDRFDVSVAFHGHAHIGSFRGETPGGTPVFNVSHELVEKELGEDSLYYVHELGVAGS